MDSRIFRSPDAHEEGVSQNAFDVAFDVPFVHRLRFTDDVFEADDHVLLDVLEGPGPARVLLCVDQAVDASLQVTARFRQLIARHADRVELVGVAVLPGGERIKNAPAELLPVLRAILDGGVDRRNYVVAVGGGAFLDAVGLAAALAHRGIRLVRLPTTTLAQADSGIGVKNAVNFFGRKNWLGTFAVPWAVINDAALLATLPDRDFRCGFAEAVKVSLLKDRAFFDQLCRTAGAIAAREPAAASYAVRRSAYWHLMHITRGGDPFETREARPLDLGHWAAHRLEAMTNFELRHGEAVAIGLAIDCTYSALAHGLDGSVDARVLGCLAALNIPLAHPALARAAELLHGLEEFRQHLGGRLTVTMLRDVGDPIDVHAVDATLMRQAIETVARR